jgi:hypothetical protein
MGRNFSAVLTFLIMLLALSPKDMLAQEEFVSTGGPLVLRSRQAQVKPGDLVSNVVRVVNTTGRRGEFGLRILPPAGWQVVGPLERTFTMAAADTFYFPVRIVALSQIQRNEPQIVSVSMLQFRNVIANENWVIVPDLRSDWSATVSRKQIITSSDADTAKIHLNVINTGDIPELFLLETSTGSKIQLINERDQVITESLFRFRLLPLQDTVLTFNLRFVNDEESVRPTTIGPSNIPSRMRLELSTEPQSGIQPKAWSSNIDIKQLDFEWMENPSAFRTLPLTLQFQAYNILDENAYGDLSLYGFNSFSPETSLSYYFQSNFISNYLNPKAFLGQYLQVNFASKYFGVDVGNISQSTDGANFSGEGARVYGVYQNHYLSAAVMQNPGIFDDTFQRRGLASEYKYSSKNFSAGAFGQLRENEIQKTDEWVGGANVNYRFLQTQNVRASVIMSSQTHNWNPDSVFEVNALGYHLNYSGSFNKFNYGALYSSFAPGHIVRPGNENIGSSLGYRINRNHSLRASFSQNKTETKYYLRGQLLDYDYTRLRQYYKLSYMFSGRWSDMSFQPTYQVMQDRFINHTFSGFDMDYRVREFYGFRFFSNTTAGYTHLPDFELDPFFTARLRASIRYSRYSLNLRYFYGPFYTNELLRFSETGTNMSRFGAGFDFDNQFFNGLFSLRFSSLYNYTTTNNQHSASIRPELFYFPQVGLRFGVYARFFGISSEMDERFVLPDIDTEGVAYASSRFEFGFSIKKDLNVPISGRRYFDLTILVFSDISGTGKKQSGDPGLRDMWVRLQAADPIAGDGRTITQGAVFEALTNRDGEAWFANIPSGNYVVTIIPVAQAASRHEARTYEIMVSDDRTVYLSIDRGARVSGSIILDRDQYTRAEFFPVGSIRITATDEEGQKFSTLTSESGQYNLYLPKGRYTISLNEDIFSDKFDLQQNNVSVEILFEQEVVTVNFVAKERARQIRIQQPDNDGQDNPNQNENNQNE